MRSNRKALYESLGALSVDIEKALLADEQESLAQLTLRHHDIMETLIREVGETDPGMMDVIDSANKNVKKLISTIQTMQTDIRTQLSTMNNRRLIQSKYQSKDAR